MTLLRSILALKGCLASDMGQTALAQQLLPRLQVALNPSALAEDGSAAKIQAAGSNKAKLRDGTASFVDVSIAADAPGRYTLRAASASRKHSMEDAAVTLQLASSNAVTAITVTPESTPTGL